MKIKSFILFGALSFGLLFLIASPCRGQEKRIHVHQFNEPVKDRVFLQEVSRKIKLDRPVSDIHLFNGMPFLLMDGNLYRLENEELKKASSAPKNILKLFGMQGHFWVNNENGLFEFKDRKWEKMDGRLYRDMTIHLGKIYAATRDAV